MRIVHIALVLASLGLTTACQGGAPAPTSAQAPAAQRPAKPIPDEEPGVTRQVREILLRQADGSVAPGLFTERARAALFPQAAADLGARLRGYGALGELQLLARAVDGEDRQYRYRALYAGATVLVEITFNKASRVGRLQVTPEQAVKENT
ncbi:hypothetical protein [Janthinobacterium sp.]|uniref:hypothetical protein n=1 Tax=Janthinobacterium sp. TaxID=1871054 RepID=UPI00293D69DB|nr:hypothetical protein [Janthinobacterium sp.]